MLLYIILYLILYSSLSSVLFFLSQYPSPASSFYFHLLFLFQYSFYTCRYLHILIYIQSFQSSHLIHNPFFLLSSSFLPQYSSPHSKYTCRCLLYIILLYYYYYILYISYTILFLSFLLSSSFPSHLLLSLSSIHPLPILFSPYLSSSFYSSDQSSLTII